jgi:hypothetical protein
MNPVPQEYQVFIILALGVVGLTVFVGSPTWYVNFLLVLVVLSAMALTRTWQDRGFYLICAGEPLVIACGMMNLWAGLFAACMVAGIVCSVLGILASGEDMRFFGFFCSISLLIALLIQFSNHVSLPLVILGIVTAAILGIQSVRMYLFRKQYSGAGT